jgi:hypothetical protein
MRSQPSDVIWEVDSLTALGGQPPEVLGAPHVINTAAGPAVAFDGRQDGLIVPVLPLAGAARFTMEMVFCPVAGGGREQRVLHVQADDSENRALLETRVADARHWFLDTFMRSDAASQTLYAEGHPHPFGPWYHVALVYDGMEMRHYVDGHSEMAGAMAFAPLAAGRTSLGVRLNRVSWFRGMIRAVCFAPLVLSPDSFQLRL